MTTKRTAILPFKPRARLLLLLGDQLIRDPGIAVFELVKNAYDADSPNVKIIMSNITDPERAKILVEDHGSGMDFKTVTDAWLEPGTDYRQQQQTRRVRTPKYERLPLGEKGVGRFAAHKLGRDISLVTRKRGNPEVVVEIDWDVFSQRRYLADVPIKVKERDPEHFKGTRAGTWIEVRRLRDSWNREMIRELARHVNSICSPFQEIGGFKADLIVPEHSKWLEGLLTADKVLEYALFEAHCRMVRDGLTYNYKFRPLPGMRHVQRRVIRGVALKLQHLDRKSLDLSNHSIGPAQFDLFIFDREPRILELGVTDKKGLKEFLDNAGGIRVYRDGIRVYDYGEPSNDWLGLGTRRVNIPARRISNNIVLGAVSLELEKSKDLVEKTNREGFVENEAYRVFRNAVLFAVAQIEAERNIDKTRIRAAYGTKPKEPVLEDLSELREIVEKKHLTKELGGYIDRIESDFVLIRDRFLTSASAGLSLAVVIHEIEKGVSELQRAVKADSASPRVRGLAKHLAELTEGFATLIRRSGMSKEKASTLITQALFNTEFRLKVHGIDVQVGAKADFEVKCSRRLIIGTLMNLVDNSIWWLDNRWGTEAKGKKRIYINATKELEGGPAILVADNGPGFLDPPEYLIQPFFSRKPDGMGLGLHLADQVMRSHGGRLEFPDRKDASVPPGFDGAIVALVFSR